MSPRLEQAIDAVLRMFPLPLRPQVERLLRELVRAILEEKDPHA